MKTSTTELFDNGLNDGRVVIVIGRPDIVAAILKRSDAEIQYFPTLTAFDSLRRSSCDDSNGESLRWSVDELLRGMCAGAQSLPPRLEIALEWLRQQTGVPPLKAFAAVFSSRRSFFRTWSKTMPGSPGEFLDRLRWLFGCRLLRQAASLAQIRDRTGLSADDVRQLIQSWH